MTAPVEVTTKFATTTDDLTAAWAFVMDRIEHVGPSPRITITPIWVISDDGDATRFEVSVSGMVEEARR